MVSFNHNNHMNNRLCEATAAWLHVVVSGLAVGLKKGRNSSKRILSFYTIPHVAGTAASLQEHEAGLEGVAYFCAGSNVTWTVADS